MRRRASISEGFRCPDLQGDVGLQRPASVIRGALRTDRSGELNGTGVRGSRRPRPPTWSIGVPLPAGTWKTSVGLFWSLTNHDKGKPRPLRFSRESRRKQGHAQCGKAWCRRHQSSSTCRRRMRLNRTGRRPKKRVCRDEQEADGVSAGDKRINRSIDSGNPLMREPGLLLREPLRQRLFRLARMLLRDVGRRGTQCSN